MLQSIIVHFNLVSRNCCIYTTNMYVNRATAFILIIMGKHYQVQICPMINSANNQPRPYQISKIEQFTNLIHKILGHRNHFNDYRHIVLGIVSATAMHIANTSHTEFCSWHFSKMKSFDSVAGYSVPPHQPGMPAHRYSSSQGSHEPGGYQHCTVDHSVSMKVAHCFKVTLQERLCPCWVPYEAACSSNTPYHFQED